MPYKTIYITLQSSCLFFVSHDIFQSLHATISLWVCPVLLSHVTQVLMTFRIFKLIQITIFPAVFKLLEKYQQRPYSIYFRQVSVEFSISRYVYLLINVYIILPTEILFFCSVSVYMWPERSVFIVLCVLQSVD